MFVASRRQTRLTALDLISYAAADDAAAYEGNGGFGGRRWVHMEQEALDALAEGLHDEALRHCIVFGVGIHHAGLNDHDRSTVEELFVSGRIQVLCCTATLAWGVNFPARLVVIKGTEFFDGKLGRYVDFPITDVLQMMGRAGRPQFDDKGVACIMVHQPKKEFYKRFLYEPFPVESSLHEALHNHISAEVAGGTIRSKHDALRYLTWTYFFRRLVMNPAYYHLDMDADDADDDDGPEAAGQRGGEDIVGTRIEAAAESELGSGGGANVAVSAARVRDHLFDLIDAVLDDLASAGCVTIEDDFLVTPTTHGHIASYYYLDYRTVRIARDSLPRVGARAGEDARGASSPALLEELCRLLSDVQEYAELPVRHNEDVLNGQLAQSVPWSVDSNSLDSPHTKAFLLLQAHLAHVPLPISDYATDTKSVLDQAPRVLNALVDIAADEGLMDVTLGLMHLSQHLSQAHKVGADPLLQLPGMNEEAARSLRRSGVHSLRDVLGPRADSARLPKRAADAVAKLPRATLSCAVKGASTDDATRWRVGCDVDCTLTVQASLAWARGPGDGGRRRSGHKAAEGAGKGKALGWWVVLELVDADGRELVALKRLAGSASTLTTSLEFAAPERAGPADLQLHLVSDSVCGIDASVPLLLEVAADP